MNVFADSSALVKLYSDEAGHEQIRKLGGFVVSCVARVEVPSAIWRKSRLGELDSSDAALLVSEFEADYYGDSAQPPRFAVVALSDAVLSDAAHLTATRGLRSYDAVQLASARAAMTADASCAALACFDRDLRTAAAADGFQLMPD